MERVLKILGWEKWQGRAFKDAMAKRKGRAEKGTGGPVDRPYSMAWLAIAGEWDDDAVSFFRLFRGLSGVGYWVGVMQYVSLHSAFTGLIPVARVNFGPVVLSTTFHVVTRKTGEKVYDGLIACDLAEITELVADTSTTSPRPSKPKPKPRSKETDEDLRDGDAEPSPTPGRKRKKTWTDEQIREIYLAYSRLEKPKRAATAIRKALKELPKDLKARGQESPEDEHAWLLARTKLRTASPLIQGKLAAGEKRYIDHPASWFNAGGHLEDPETWKEDEDGGQPSEAARRRAEKRGREYGEKPSLR